MNLVRTVAAVVMLLSLATCDSAMNAGQEEAIRGVQETYDAEFLAAIRRHGMDAPTSRFAGTLDRIAALRATDPDARVAAYLDLLEGMVFLQTGQTGLAAARSGDVAAAARSLGSGDPVLRRNALLAKSFDDLVHGVEAHGNVTALPSGAFDDATQISRIALARQLNTSAGHLRGSLCAERKAGRIASAAEDGGAALVAGYAATFLTTVDATAQFLCVNSVRDAELCAVFLPARRHLVDARDLMATFPVDGNGGDLRQLRADIDSRLARHYGASAVPPPTDTCP